MFRSSTILRELVQNLAKVIFLLKHSVLRKLYIVQSPFHNARCNNKSHNGIFVRCKVPCACEYKGGLTFYYICLQYILIVCINAEFMGLYFPF